MLLLRDLVAEEVYYMIAIGDVGRGLTLSIETWVFVKQTGDRYLFSRFYDYDTYKELKGEKPRMCDFSPSLNDNHELEFQFFTKVELVSAIQYTLSEMEEDE